jgi:hypothetical protein
LHSRRDGLFGARALRALCIAALLLTARAGLAQQDKEPPVAAASGIATSHDVARAVAAVRADPNLGGPRTERTLRLKSDDDGKRRPAPSAPWLIEMLRWMSEAGRGLVWLLGAIAVALLLVTAWRWMRVRADAAAGRVAVLPPSHVHDLDIRPDSLPADIADSARVLWQRGEQRAALSLLYRGALSRLVHGHGVAIGAASTEGECLELAQAALPAAAGTFFERLVGAWQIAVYAARWPDPDSVATLLDGFDAHFGAGAARAASPAPVEAAA